jgi:hypothetical protein
MNKEGMHIKNEMVMFKNLFFCCAAASTLVCNFFESRAIGVTPFSKSIVPSSDGNSVQYTLTNNFDHVIAFEIKILVRKQDINGNDVLEPDDHACTIYPRHLIVKPKSKRHCILKVTGGDPKIEKAYRVVITQHNVNFSETKVKQSTIAMEIKLQAHAALYISPADKIRKIEIVSVKKEVKDGKESFAIQIKNTGNTRILTKDMSDKVLVFGKKLQLKELFAHREGVVLAGNEVIFNVTQEDMAASEAKLKETKDKKAPGVGAKAPEQPKTANLNPQPQETPAAAAAEAAKPQETTQEKLPSPESAKTEASDATPPAVA